MKKVVVFGGTGYVGSHICRTLASNGFQVVSISRTAKRKYLTEDTGISIIKADLFNDTIWQEELTDCYAVVHSIGILFQSKKVRYKHLIFETTQLIAETAIEKGVKNVVYISAIKPPFFLLKKYYYYKMKSEALLRKKHFNLKIIRPGIIASPKKLLFLLFYRLQELLRLPVKPFETVEGVSNQVLQFLI